LPRQLAHLFKLYLSMKHSLMKQLAQNLAQVTRTEPKRQPLLDRA
jgi:hypothetical protein